MKNSNLFCKLSCMIPSLLIACMVNLKAQDELIGYTFLLAESNHTYYLSNCEATWEEANEAALEMGGQLVTFNYMWEYHLLMYYLDGNQESYWIGLRGENSVYEWASGDPFSFTAWMDYEPSHADGAVLVDTEYWDGISANTWTSHPVSGEFKFVVEFPGSPNCTYFPNKTYVCHNGNTLCISASALQSHLDHGCLEGPCGPCNINAMQATPGEIEASEGHSHHALNGSHSELHDEHESDYRKMLPNQIQIFPNPASEQILVLLPEGIQNGTIGIFSLTGQEMYKVTLREQKSIQLDLSSFAQGIYLIKVQAYNGHYEKTFVKL